MSRTTPRRGRERTPGRGHGYGRPGGLAPIPANEGGTWLAAGKRRAVCGRGVHTSPTLAPIALPPSRAPPHERIVDPEFLVPEVLAAGPEQADECIQHAIQ
jgi:hypothetical protein